MQMFLVFSLLAYAILGLCQTIVLPTPGTAIQPGAAFDFEYDGMADYGVSSYNFTVFLFTEAPASFTDSQSFARGYYFGRFSQPNYPANPYPSNPAPAQLVMPDFSKKLGGFGAGLSTTDGQFYLTVLEEYATGAGAAGFRLAFSTTQIVYNGTRTD